MASAEPADSPRRVKKRFVIPAIVLLVLLGVFVWLYIRGTVADAAEHNPGTPFDATVTQLYSDADGNVMVRSAVIIDVPLKDVWAVIADYDSHAKFMPYVSSLTATAEGDGKYHLTGVAHSRVWGDWPFDSHVQQHMDRKQGVARVTWDEQGDGELAVNRGGWELRKIRDARTLLIFTLQVETVHYPNFIVRNIIMDRLPAVVQSVRDEVKRRGA
jgi:uncharacterized membrane protein